MHPLIIAILAGVGFIIAYHTYGRWLGKRIFQLSANAICPSRRLSDGNDYVPTPKPVVFGHHFTSIAGTGPIVGPAIAIMWGWLPALLWVLLGSIFIGAVHDLGALVVSLRNNGQTVGDIAGRLLNSRIRLLFLLVLFMALTIVLAIFGLVIASVFKMYPAAIFPCVIQIPIAIAIGVWLYRRGAGLLLPSFLALAIMYLTVVFGDVGILHTINTTMAAWPVWAWVVLLLVYSYIASVLPVWILLQPRDYINSLQLISALGLILIGLVWASFQGGAPPVLGAERPTLQFVAPRVDWNPAGAPAMFPFLFITIACGAISGFHCLVSSGTTSKQLKNEPDARFVGYGSMLTEGFLATLVILACGAGLGLGLPIKQGSIPINGIIDPAIAQGLVIGQDGQTALVGSSAFDWQYPSWGAADTGLGTKVGAFVIGSANFCNALGIPMPICIALMGVLVASFAGTTLDTACRLQRYVIQELAATFLPRPEEARGFPISPWPPERPHQAQGFPVLPLDAQVPQPVVGAESQLANGNRQLPITFNPLTWLRNMHGATLFAITIAALMAAVPLPDQSWSLANTGKGGMILWPLFGATNQLLGGLAFMVITFYLWRRGKPIWFLILPMIFMLIMPAWAMAADLPNWWAKERYVLVGIAAATLLLEAWMVVEAILLFPKARQILEQGALDQPAPAALAT